MVREILTGGSHRVICNLINGRTRILPADPPLEFAYLPVLGDKQSGFKLKYVGDPCFLVFFFPGAAIFMASLAVLACGLSLVGQAAGFVPGYTGSAGLRLRGSAAPNTVEPVRTRRIPTSLNCEPDAKHRQWPSVERTAGAAAAVMMHELERFRMVALATLCGVVLSTSPAASQELPQVTAPDANHAIVKEALTVVEEHFIDLKNPKGVADSSTRQVFNGVDWKALEAAEAEKALKDRGASYTEIASALKKLGDKYTRFVKPSDFAKLTKYDVTGVGVLIVEKDGRLVSVIQYSLLVLNIKL